MVDVADVALSDPALEEVLLFLNAVVFFGFLVTFGGGLRDMLLSEELLREEEMVEEQEEEDRLGGCSLLLLDVALVAATLVLEVRLTAPRLELSSCLLFFFPLIVMVAKFNGYKFQIMGLNSNLSRGENDVTRTIP